MSGPDLCPHCGGRLDRRTYMVEVDDDLLLARRGEQVVRLTATECEVLACLADGRVVHKRSIHDSLYWRRSDDETPLMKSIDVRLCHLRKRLAPLGLAIVTIGTGRLQLVDAAEAR